MRYLFELSLEHETLPKKEVLSIVQTYVNEFRIRNENTSFIEIETKESIPQSVFKRLAMTYYVNEVLYDGDFSEIIEISKKLRPLDSYAVRVKKITHHENELSSSEIEHIIGRYIQGMVSLVHPKIEYRVIITDKYYLCRNIMRINRGVFEKRKPQYRPFFSPISIHPRIARTMVNLAMVKENDVLIDPFCGTGGILIEAGLMHIRCIGSDISQYMVDGCKKNLNFFGLNNFLIYKRDIGEIDTHCDAIVTDPPYGRATTTKNENIGTLYDRAFNKFYEILRDEKYCVIVLPDIKFISIGSRYLDFIESYPIYVHKSLTRYICVFKT